MAANHQHIQIAGIIGSIDNMYGSDVTTGSDTALHRIEATDAISSTAASRIAHLCGRGDGAALRLPSPDGEPSPVELTGCYRKSPRY
ncbi:MAG: hypothetical protein R3D55_17580 [Chloroflexota bacterium]